MYIHDKSAGFFYIIICQTLFLPLRIHFHLCFLSVRICTNVLKTLCDMNNWIYLFIYLFFNLFNVDKLIYIFDIWKED